jgi:hypothetical protein
LLPLFIVIGGAIVLGIGAEVGYFSKKEEKEKK